MNTNKGLLYAAAGLGAALGVRALVRQLVAWDLKDKVAIVTGGSRGLGLVIARQLARQGARVAICARDAGEVERGRQDIEQYGRHVFGAVCDITDRNQVERFVGQVRMLLGPVDILINNAGVIQVGPMEHMTLADYEEAMQSHFWAPLYNILAVLPDMRRRKQGRIVNITSIGGKVSVPHLLPYGASKFALVGLSEGLRAELAKDGIRVTTVCPGLMRTGSPPNAFFKGQHRAEYTWFSIGDAIPIISMSAERAASRIIRAMQVGEAEIILTIPAKLAVWFHGLFPGTTADLLSIVNRFLPGPGGIGAERARGKDSASAVVPSWLTALSDKAAQRNNELPSR